MSDNSTIKKVGITGGAGVIGSILSSGLYRKYQLTIFDIHPPKNSSYSNYVKVDLAEPKNLNGIFDGFDAIIHLAGNPSPMAPAAETLKINYDSTSYVFEEAKKADVKKIVFASSNFYHEDAISQLIQGKRTNNIKLNEPPTPISLYGQSKVFGENLGYHLSNLGMQFVALRIGWSVLDDNPRSYTSQYMNAMFCSHRDLVQAFEKAIQIETKFMVAFAISNNKSKLFDMEETEKLLNFHPIDDSDKY